VTFDDLCRDFNRRRPKGPIIKRIPWFTARWSDDVRCIRQMLVRHLKDFGYEYLDNMGTIWFLYQGAWKCADYKVDGETVQFFLCEFIEN